MMDRSTTPKVSQLGQNRRPKVRSRSGSEELNQIIGNAQAAKTRLASTTATGPHTMSTSSSSSSSGLVSPGTPVAERLNSPGVLSWVRNALMLGSASPGRGITSPLASSFGDDSFNQQDSSVMPGTMSLPNKYSPYVKREKEGPFRSLLPDVVTSDQSSWNPLDRSQRRYSSVSNATTLEDDSISTTSSDEDVYAPFTFKEGGPIVADEGSKFEESEIMDILPSPSQETSLPVKSIPQSFSSHLSIYQAQDSNQFVQDTTTTVHTMPDLVLTPPDSTFRDSSPLSPSAGWMDTTNGGRPGIDRRSSHNKTPTPGNILGKMNKGGVGSTDSSNNFFSTENSDNAEFDTKGDGEDLEDFLGRPLSPEDLAKNRPSRETVVLGSRGASSRSSARGNILKSTVARQEEAEIDQEYIDTTSPISPSINRPTNSPTLTKSAIDRRGRSEGFAVSERLGENNIVQTASPQPRRAMNFFTRRREVSFGGGKGTIEVEKQETNKKDFTATNPTFWRLGKRQSSHNSNLNLFDGVNAKVEETEYNVTAKNEQLDSLNKLSVQRPKMRTSQESDRSVEFVTPSKASLRATSGDSASKGCKKKSGVALLGPSMQPRSIKVRRLKKTTKDRDFARVYLAQELFLNGNACRVEEVGATESDLKPVLAHLDSSSSVASSLASSSTKGSGNTSAKRKATWAMKFSLDGKYLAVAGQDAIIRIYGVLDTEEARKKVEFDAAMAIESVGLPGQFENRSTSSINSLEKNSIGRKSFSSKAGTGKLSSLPNLAVFHSAPIREFKGHTNDILDLNWSKGGFLLSASMDKTVRVWHLAHPNSLVSFLHGDFVTSAVFHPRDDRFFLSGSLDGKLRLWNISAKKVQSSQEVPGLITACAFTESGKTACVGTFAGHALFYQTEGLIYSSSIAVRSPSGKHAKGGRKITSIEPLLSLPASSSINSTTKAQGERILITSNDSRIRAYDLKNKSMIARFKAKTYTNRTSQIRASVSDDNIFVVAGSEATFAEGGQVQIWNASNHLLETTKRTSTKSLPSSLSTDFNVEYFSAHSGTVTCAIMAPLSTNVHLKHSNDYLLQESERKLAYNAKTSISPTSSLSNALSNAVQFPIKFATGSYEVDTRRLNRIIISVDENAVVRIFRSDSLQTVEG